MLPLQKLAFRVHSFAALIALVLADPNDWVNVEYVISQAKDQGRSPTDDARAIIIRNAQTLAAKGPWSVTNHKDVLPPSQDAHDYLSWAPYHWPQCNWCTKAGRTNLAHTSAGSGPNDTATSTSTYSISDPNDAYGNAAVLNLSRRLHRQQRLLQGSLPFNIAIDQGGNVVATRLPVPDSPAENPASFLSATPAITSILIPTALPAIPIPNTTSMSESRSRGPAQAAAKTSKTSCIPSPTSSLAPSATWTTCEYIGRDGQVNPDVRTLKGPDAINDLAQAIIYNAVAYVLTQSATYSANVATWIETFFVNPETKMNPNMNYGQMVRGPGTVGVTGTFTGVLDLRGMVKVINAILIAKSAGSPDWIPSLEKAMGSWMFDYVSWLSTSAIGKETASRPNNHGTFFTSQMTAAEILAGNRDGAETELQKFFSTTFLDQIARTGEQPFEAIRTRPFHYRCFNLEALITNAKLGDQVGMNLWNSKSKYGATIQTAVDFMMTLSPKGEDPTLLNPHVASVAAAYGDPNGKYASFLAKKDPNYKSKSYWFYDQNSAMPNAPSSSKVTRRAVWQREDSPHAAEPDPLIVVPFECPSGFRDAPLIEIDDGLFVSCKDLEPFYM